MTVFCGFWHFSAKNLAFFSNNQRYEQFFAWFSFALSQKRQFSPFCWRKKFKKTITPVSCSELFDALRQKNVPAVAWNGRTTHWLVAWHTSQVSCQRALGLWVVHNLPIHTFDRRCYFSPTIAEYRHQERGSLPEQLVEEAVRPLRRGRRRHGRVA
jgi:hypothetical protein